MNRYETREQLMHDLGLLKDELTEKYLVLECASEGDEHEDDLACLDKYIDTLDAAIEELNLMNEIVRGLIK